jgi:hypothetical protein
MGKWAIDIEEFDVGFDAISPGRYVFQIEEGVQTYEADSGAVSIGIPLTAIETKDDELEDQIGKKITWFQNILKKNGDTNPMGEKMIIRLLAVTLTGDYVDSKLGDDDDISDPDTIEILKGCLPGRKLIGTVIMGKDGQGKDRPEPANFKKYSKAKPYKPGKGASGGESKKKEVADADVDDWD